MDIDQHIQTKHKIPRDNKTAIYSCINLPCRDLLVQQDCQPCGSSFVLPEVELLRHTVTCHGESKLPEFSHSQRVSRTCRICLFSTNNSYRMEKHLSQEHRPKSFAGGYVDTSRVGNLSSPQPNKSKVPSKLKVLSSPEEKSYGFKKKSKKSKEKEVKSKEMKAERKEKKRQRKDQSGSKKTVKKLAKLEMSELLNLKKQFESELEKLNKEDEERAGRVEEGKGKKRHQKNPCGSKKNVKKLAKLEMSELLDLKKKFEEELENMNTEEHSSDCAKSEKKAVTLKKTVRFFGNK